LCELTPDGPDAPNRHVPPSPLMRRPGAHSLDDCSRAGNETRTTRPSCSMIVPFCDEAPAPSRALAAPRQKPADERTQGHALCRDPAARRSLVCGIRSGKDFRGRLSDRPGCQLHHVRTPLDRASRRQSRCPGGPVPEQRGARRSHGGARDRPSSTRDTRPGLGSIAVATRSRPDGDTRPPHAATTGHLNGSRSQSAPPYGRKAGSSRSRPRGRQPA